MNNNDLRDQLFRDLFDLTGQVAIVTGGLGRLGREYVSTLAHAGAAVVAFDLAGSADTFAGLVSAGLRVRTDLLDVTDRAAVEAAVTRVAAAFGTPTSKRFTAFMSPMVPS